MWKNSYNVIISVCTCLCFTKVTLFCYFSQKYVARVVGHLETTNPARIPKFKENATERVKFILGDFSEWQFFWGESMNEDGMTALMYFKDGVTPCMLFWKDGVVEEKVVCIVDLYEW